MSQFDHLGHLKCVFLPYTRCENGIRFALQHQHAKNRERNAWVLLSRCREHLGHDMTLITTLGRRGSEVFRFYFQRVAY